jgi:hypothetical protein
VCLIKYQIIKGAPAQSPGTPIIPTPIVILERFVY